MTFDNKGNINLEMKNQKKTFFVAKEFAEKNMQLPLLFAFASNSMIEMHTKGCEKGDGGFAEFKIFRDNSQKPGDDYK